MADVMRATTPINNRNIITPTKEHRDASALPFDFQDLSKIKTTNAQSEMLSQNNVLRENGSSATALFSMLRDPDVATSFLKNIFFLREIVGLMPLNNETQTEEMQQLLNRLILTPEEIPQEMINQENIATIFKGDLFDTLRKLLFSNGKSVSENIAEKFHQIPLAQIKDGGEQLSQSAQTQNNHPQQQTTQNAQNGQNSQPAQAQQTNQQTQNNPLMPQNTQTNQPMVEGFIAPQENQQPQNTAPQTNPDGQQQNFNNQQPQSTFNNVNQQPADGVFQNMQNPQAPQTQESMGNLQNPQGFQYPQQENMQNLNQQQQNVMQNQPQQPLENGQLPQQTVFNTPAQQPALNDNNNLPTDNNNQQNFNSVNNNQNQNIMQGTAQELNGQQRENINIFFKTATNIREEIPQLLENNILNEAPVVNPDKVVTQRDLQDSILNLLKAINTQQNRADVLDAVKNNLLYLKDSFPETSEYNKQLDTLVKSFEALMSGKLPKESFQQTKSQTLNLLDSLQNSVLYDENMAKTSGLAKYNLSRYNSNDNLITDAFSKLLQNVPDKELQQKLTNDLIRYFENEPLREASFESKTMSALAEILEKQAGNLEAKMLNADSIDKIVHGLLSSPSNFTPLLHYVIPVDNGQTQAMAEIWINPNGEEDVEGGVNSGKKMTHMLVVFEIDGIGKFETELYAEDKNITLSVMCPPEYVSNFKGVNGDIRRACESTGYRFKSIEITELKESRSLIDVFRSLPARRSGINVTI